MAEQLDLDLEPDRWIVDLLDDLLVPSAPATPDSAEMRAEVAARMDEHDAALAAAWAKAIKRPRQPPPGPVTRVPENKAWLKIYKRIGHPQAR